MSRRIQQFDDVKKVHIMIYEVRGIGMPELDRVTLFYYFLPRRFLLLIFSGDHALIDINKLLGLNPKQVTVRTKSRDSQSADSVPTPIPSAALKNKTSKVWVMNHSY
jgi:hypothetical protein